MQWVTHGLSYFIEMIMRHIKDKINLPIELRITTHFNSLDYILSILKPSREMGYILRTVLDDI